MKKLIVLIYIAFATFLFGYVKAGEIYPCATTTSELEKFSSSFDCPVHFEDLNVKLINNKAEISWSTLTEKNNKQFEIQRSTDGKNFKTIAIVFTLQDSQEVRNYKFSDGLKGVEERQLSYRIKQVDTGEGFSFSKTVSPEI